MKTNGIKEQKRAREMRNLSEGGLERSRGRRRREKFNEEHRKAERNRVTDKTLMYNGVGCEIAQILYDC